MGLADQLRDKTKSITYYRQLQKYASQPIAKISGLISLTLLTIAFFGFFAILPTLKTIGKLNKQVEDAQTINQKLEKKIDDLEKAEIIYDQIMSEIYKVERVLPEDNQFERLAWQISYLAMEEDISLEKVDFESFVILGDESLKEKEEDYKLNFSLSVSGEYQNLAAFLKNLRLMDRLVILDQVNLSGGKTESNQVSVTINASAYYLAQGEESEE